jgi:hypothetical protein
MADINPIDNNNTSNSSDSSTNNSDKPISEQTSNVSGNIDANKPGDTGKATSEQYSWLRKYQWKKGQSGNPKGHPTGEFNLKSLIKNVLEETSGKEITLPDGTKKVLTNAEVVSRQLIGKAMYGNKDFIKMVLEIFAAKEGFEKPLIQGGSRTQINIDNTKVNILSTILDKLDADKRQQLIAELIRLSDESRRAGDSSLQDEPTDVDREGDIPAEGVFKNVETGSTSSGME